MDSGKTISRSMVRRTTLLGGGLLVSAVAALSGGCAATDESPLPEPAGLAPQATSTSTAPAPTPTWCPTGEFYFDGACRNNAWVLSTFGGHAHPGVIGGLGVALRGGTPSMLLVETLGGPDGAPGYMVTYTGIKPTHVDTTQTGQLTLRPPSRGGYAIQVVMNRIASFPGPYLDETSEETFKPLGAMLVKTSWRTIQVDYHTGISTICDPTGCIDPIASSGGATASVLCGQVISDVKDAAFLGCTGVAAVIGWMGGGSIGLAGGLLAAPETAGASVVLVTIGGAGTGAAGGVAVADVVCGPVSNLVVPSSVLTTACVSAMSGSATTSAAPGAGIVLTPTSGSGTATPGVACTGTVIVHVSGIQITNGSCEADVDFTCSGTVDSGGNCVSSGSCSPSGIESGSLACVTVTGE
jgi:hypothetical protein